MHTRRAKRNRNDDERAESRGDPDPDGSPGASPSPSRTVDADRSPLPERIRNLMPTSARFRIPLDPAVLADLERFAHGRRENLQGGEEGGELGTEGG